MRPKVLDFPLLIFGILQRKVFNHFSILSIFQPEGEVRGKKPLDKSLRDDL